MFATFLASKLSCEFECSVFEAEADDYGLTYLSETDALYLS